MKQPRIEYQEESHIYTINGEIYPSLSKVVAVKSIPGLEVWRQRVGDEEAERVSNEAADLGSLVHLVTEFHDKGMPRQRDELLDYHPELLPHLLAWDEWVREYIETWIMVEIIVWSSKLKVAGRIDRVGMIRGDKNPSIVDIKTGSLYDEIGIRLAGYRLMYNENRKWHTKELPWAPYNKPVERRVVIQLPRNEPGELHFKDYTRDKYEPEFIECCQTYHQMYD